jgi:hypothetical protein
MRFPKTHAAWCRLKLNLAALLVLSLAKGDHTRGYLCAVVDASDAIESIRTTYYPR